MNPSSQAVLSPTPIRCLVIQLSRTGDTIQSLMALRAAKQLYPQLEIHFVARSRFAQAAKRVAWLAEVIELPTEELLGPYLAGTQNESQTLAELSRWLAPLMKTPWDMLVNWSFSESSSYLAGLIPSRVKLGYTRKKDSSFCGADGWSHYFQGVIQSGIPQNIHITDILTTQILTALQIHAGDPLPDGGAHASSKAFFSLALKSEPSILPGFESQRRTIAFQLGEGEKSPGWPAQYWANLAQYIVTRHPDWKILLLGAPSDRTKEAELLAHLDQHTRDSGAILSRVGQTDFDHWIAGISQAQWVFTGDSAAVHLASVLGTRVIQLSLGQPSYAERGPYGTGHYILSSESPEEGASEVTPESAYLVWLHGSSEWSKKNQQTLETQAMRLGWGSFLEKMKILRSRIRDASDGGGVVYEPVIRRPLSLQEWSAKAMGHIARSWYCGWVPPIRQELSREDVSPKLIQKLREMQESSEILIQICAKGTQIALLLNQKSANLKSDRIMHLQDREELRLLGQELMELENLIDRLAATHPPLAAFSKMTKVLMHHLKGDQLTVLGREASQAYHELKSGIQIFLDWIQFTLELSKPVAIQTRPQPSPERSLL
ncbi:MAG: glycosyltransferase family 9 protein [Bdellovibrionia bacterium]